MTAGILRVFQGSKFFFNAEVGQISKNLNIELQYTAIILPCFTADILILISLILLASYQSVRETTMILDSAMEGKMNVNDQVVKAPKSSPHTEVEQLGYLEAYDAVVDADYAFVIYKEIKENSGNWVIRIKGSATAGTVFDPTSTALKNAFKKAAAHEEPHIVWGFNLQSKETDPRLVENRVLIDNDGKPTAIEIHLITRKADGSAMPEKIVTVDWPG